MQGDLSYPNQTVFFLKKTEFKFKNWLGWAEGMEAARDYPLNRGPLLTFFPHRPPQHLATSSHLLLSSILLIYVAMSTVASTLSMDLTIISRTQRDHVRARNLQKLYATSLEENPAAFQTDSIWITPERY